jgi:hypothetical protein
VFFKAGHCEKGEWGNRLSIESSKWGHRLIGVGNKCKFSHDPNVGRKTEKVNIYADQREEKAKGEWACPIGAVAVGRGVGESLSIIVAAGADDPLQI